MPAASRMSKLRLQRHHSGMSTTVSLMLVQMSLGLSSNVINLGLAETPPLGQNKALDSDILDNGKIQIQ